MKNKIAISAFALSLAFFVSCKNEQQPQDAPTLSLPVVETAQRDMVGYQAFPVSIEGKVNNAVRAKISGYITQVYVDEGQVVKAGQPLFKLETTVQAQDANAARSGISAAKGKGSAAEAAVDAAQAEVDALVPLVEENIIRTGPWPTAKANLRRAEGQLAQARAAEQRAQ